MLSDEAIIGISAGGGTALLLALCACLCLCHLVRQERKRTPVFSPVVRAIAAGKEGV